MKKHILIITMGLLLSACDCNQIANGTVVDADTQKPLDSVFVYNQNRSANKTYTDTSGIFMIESISGGLFGCPPMEVVVEKAGYEKQILKINCCDIENIALKKLK
ncbi:MAG TPA: hypothetical protein VKG26_13360 [Bacteroidia bacterium]|nr:hypothetical protein [Bacteroidia bacterium]